MNAMATKPGGRGPSDSSPHSDGSEEKEEEEMKEVAGEEQSGSGKEEGDSRLSNNNVQPV